MRQTLFHIPHEILGLPLFGIGWALAVWAVVFAVLALQSWRRNEFSREVAGFSMVMAVVAAAIVFVIPNLESQDVNGSPMGLPIRGYGVFLLCAVLSGVLLAAYRSGRAGMNPDSIYSLAFWMFAAGIGGARAFFVIEYWDQFQRETVLQTLIAVAKFTEGGLVVYGSLIGALIAFMIFCRRHKLSWLAVGDVIAPSLALGLAIGRLGCLMNGCCYGGVCLEGPSIQFPKASQPYISHVQNGELLGMKLQRPDSRVNSRRVLEVEPGSVADRAGIEPRERVEVVSPGAAWKAVQLDPRSDTPLVTAKSSGGARAIWTLNDLPDWSLPVHPTQLYSAANGGLLCLLLLVYHPIRRRDGETLALLLSLYPITRYLLELIRIDEPGQFGTALTISQWVSIGLLILSMALWAKLLSSPSGSRADVAQATGGTQR